MDTSQYYYQEMDYEEKKQYNSKLETNNERFSNLYSITRLVDGWCLEVVQSIV